MRAAMAMLLGTSLVLAGCAGGGEGDDPAPQGTAVDGFVEIVGNDQLDFIPSEISSDTGELTIEMVCAGSAPHTLVIEETGELVVECTGNSTGEGDVSLEPGTYDFFCSIPGHRRAGMVGVLTIEG